MTACKGWQDGPLALNPTAPRSRRSCVRRFLWLASSHGAAHCGATRGHFAAGSWAGGGRRCPRTATPRTCGSILSDFDGADGGRRQEIVFIGVGRGAAAAIRGPKRVLPDDEMAAYRAADDDARPELFPSDLRVRA